MSSIGPLELVVSLIIIILLYALGKVPEFGGSVSKGIGEFRLSARGGKRSGKSNSVKDANKDASITGPTA